MSASGEDAEAEPGIVPVLGVLPDPCHGEGRAAGQMDEVRVFAVVRRLPLVETIGGHEAPAVPEGFAEDGLVGHRLGAGVDGKELVPGRIPVCRACPPHRSPGDHSTSYGEGGVNLPGGAVVAGPGLSGSLLDQFGEGSLARPFPGIAPAHVS